MNPCRKAVAAVGFIILLAMAARCADWNAANAPEYDQLFQRTNGWIGADGNFAVTLTNGLTLWLFSDTFVGEIRGGRRVRSIMINNSAAWQRGNDPSDTRLEFFHGPLSDGKPKALITPADGKGWFWLFDGVMVRDKLFLFLPQIERTDDKSVFGFRRIGVWLGEVSNPLAPPTQWRVVQRKIPFAQFRTNEGCTFGSAVLATNGFVYVYGTREQKSAKTMILARVPETALADFSSWRFRTRDDWSPNVADAADLCAGMASEYSVTWLPARHEFVLICTENGLSEKILARTAPSPWGPWSAPTMVYRCPEAAWDKRIFCYAAKAHPMLASAPDELIVTYAANSFDFGQVVNDARLYWPRFVRIKSSGTNPR